MQKLETLIKVLEISKDAVFILDNNGDILDCNSSACTIFAYAKDELIGLNVNELLVSPSGDALDDFNKSVYLKRNAIDRNKFEFPVEFMAKTVKLEEEVTVMFVKDNSTEEKLQERLYYLSHFDELTGLRNRKAIYEFIENQEEPCAISLVDLDDFKALNDKHGHQAGDQVLIAFSKLIALEESIVAGRIGGQEFLLCHKNTCKADAAEVLNDILEEANMELPEYGGVRFSAGTGFWNKKDSLKKVMQKVDRRIYKAKYLGKNQVCIED